MIICACVLALKKWQVACDESCVSSAYVAIITAVFYPRWQQTMTYFVCVLLLCDIAKSQSSNKCFGGAITSDMTGVSSADIWWE